MGFNVKETEFVVEKVDMTNEDIVKRFFPNYKKYEYIPSSLNHDGNPYNTTHTGILNFETNKIDGQTTCKRYDKIETNVFTNPAYLLAVEVDNKLIFSLDFFGKSSNRIYCIKAPNTVPFYAFVLGYNGLTLSYFDCDYKVTIYYEEG